ncbi:hypothetical protein N8I77_004069 [Diaporthe amygdali]|uniref:Chromatin modification-related protein EAF6 n=1 Tax=Phomopsis amygdali TaxID=1214568 RepID=A0AAD9W5K8_PHOAM|nr:hypothetical protein N8I77_004069 [Diaporthe amygdali]
MPAKKRIKLSYKSANSRNPSETDHREARRAAHLAALRSAREDFDPPFDVEENDADEGDANDENVQNSDDDTQSDPEQETTVQSSTQENTRLNAGFSTSQGYSVAQQHLRNALRYRYSLLSLSVDRSGHWADQDVQGEPAKPQGLVDATARRDASLSPQPGYTSPGPLDDPTSILGGPESGIFTTETTTEPTDLQVESSSSAPTNTDTPSSENQAQRRVHWPEDAKFEPKATTVTVITVITMTENNQTAAGADAPGGLPFYEQSRTQLKTLLAKRRDLERKLANIEEKIYNNETEYLESTQAGNIMTGFDNYTKGTNAAAAQRRKGGTMEQHRVFSRSSISYNANAADSTANTPGSSHAPTPVSTTFAGGSGSNHPTPTSATASTGKAGGGGGSKKDKKKAVSLSVDAADSESDINVKKVRTNFGASRK